MCLQALEGNKPWDKSVPASFSLSEPAEPGLLPHAFSLSLLCLILSHIKHPEKNPRYFMKSLSLSARITETDHFAVNIRKTNPNCFEGFVFFKKKKRK